MALSRIFDIGMQLFGLVALFNIPCLMYGFGKWSIIEVTAEENVYLWFYALSVFICSLLTYFLFVRPLFKFRQVASSLLDGA